MKTPRLLRYSCSLALLATPVLLLPAADGPRSKTDLLVIPDRNPVNLAARDVPTDFSGEEDNEKNVKWKAQLGDHSYGGPVIAGGKVFVGTNNKNPRDPAIKGDKGILMCFDAKTGKFLWQAVHDKLPGGNATDYPEQGVASTPAVDGDRLYYVSNRCELVCADVNGDPKTKKAKFFWKLDMIRELGVFPCQLATCSPLIVGDLVFVVTGNGVDVTADPWTLPAPKAPSFIAVNKKTGKVVWQDNSPGKDIMEGQWSNPVFAHPKGGRPQVIFPGGDGWLYAFDAVKPDKPIWKFNGNPRGARFDPKNKRRWDRAYYIATPVVHDGRLYVGMGRNPDHGTGPGRLWCLDVGKKGDVTPPDESYDPKSPANRDSAVVWQFGGKIVPRPLREREYRFGLTMSACCVVDGLVYVADLDGFFYCFDAKTGQKYWRHDTRSELWAAPYFAGGKVFVGNHDGDLYIFDHGKQYKKPRVIPFGRGIKQQVVYADGLLYVMTDTTLFAFEKK